MALLPYIMDELRPRRLTDQLFGLSLTPDDFLTDIIDRPILKARYMRPWRNFAVKDVGSTIKSDKDKFQVNLDVQHFAPEEISVKTSNGYVIIEGKHEEKQDEHGYVSRQFSRRYSLPEDVNPEAVESKLSSDGVLTIIAHKATQHKDERSIPITQTGPVRRKTPEDNGEIEQEQGTKSPQKKRRR